MTYKKGFSYQAIGTFKVLETADLSIIRHLENKMVVK